jgi:hypothetical protein
MIGYTPHIAENQRLENNLSFSVLFNEMKQGVLINVRVLFIHLSNLQKN